MGVSILKQPVKAVLLDWAGTTIDYGSLAPVRAFVEVFRRRGIEITTAEARGPMGRAKRDHIVDIAALPRVAGCGGNASVMSRVLRTLIRCMMSSCHFRKKYSLLVARLSRGFPRRWPNCEAAA